MFLWWVQYDGREWGSFVIAETRSKAKTAFWRFYNDGWNEWTDIRCQKQKPADGYEPAVLDDSDDPRLTELGVFYRTGEE